MITRVQGEGSEDKIQDCLKPDIVKRVLVILTCTGIAPGINNPAV